jgi:hypothetical protein
MIAFAVVAVAPRHDLVINGLSEVERTGRHSAVTIQELLLDDFADSFNPL